MTTQSNKKIATAVIVSGVLLTTTLALPACTPKPNNPSDPKQPVVKADENSQNVENSAIAYSNSTNPNVLYGPAHTSKTSK